MGVTVGYGEEPVERPAKPQQLGAKTREPLPQLGWGVESPGVPMGPYPDCCPLGGRLCPSPCRGTRRGAAAWQLSQQTGGWMDSTNRTTVTPKAASLGQ